MSTGQTPYLAMVPSDGSEQQLLPIVDSQEAHRSYIISTWVKSYDALARHLKVSNRYEGLVMTKDVYRDGESRLAEQNWHNSKVIVSPDDEFTIHGWVCSVTGSSGHTLLHVYVPPEFRSMGVGRGLVEYTCGKTYQVMKPWPKTPRGHNVIWNPYNVPS